MTPGRPLTSQGVLWVPTNLTVALADCTLSRQDRSDVLSQDKTAADTEAATGPAVDNKAGPADDSQTGVAGCPN